MKQYINSFCKCLQIQPPKDLHYSLIHFEKFKFLRLYSKNHKSMEIILLHLLTTQTMFFLTILV